MSVKNLRAACFAAIISVALVISAGVANGEKIIGIGSLKVVAMQAVPPFVDVGKICVPAGAILENSEVEPVIANDVVVRVDGNFAYGDLESLAVSIGDEGLGRIGPVEAEKIYHFDGKWRFDKGEEKELEVSVFVKSGAGHNFSASVIDIVATGEIYGFQVPVYGLPIGGCVIGIVGPEPIKPTIDISVKYDPPYPGFFMEVPYKIYNPTDKGFIAKVGLYLIAGPLSLPKAKINILVPARTEKSGILWADYIPADAKPGAYAWLAVMSKQGKLLDLDYEVFGIKLPKPELPEPPVPLEPEK